MNHVSDTKGTESPFTPAHWVRATTTLLKNGFLEIINADTGSLIYKSNMKKHYSSGIRQLEYSVFHLSNVLFLGEYPKTDLPTPLHEYQHTKDDSISHASDKSLLTSNSKSKRRHKKDGHVSTTRAQLHKHTRHTVCKSDQAIYIKLENQDDARNWFLALKSFPRLQVFAPSTGNPDKAFRIARTLTLLILEAKVDINELSSISNTQLLQYPELYVEICFSNRVWGRTSASKPTKSPFWREEFTFTDIMTPSFPHVSLHIRRRLTLETDDPTDDPLVGIVTLAYEDLISNGNVEKWYKIGSPDQPGRHESSICMKIKLEEMKIASSKHYKRFKDSLASLSDRSLALLTMSEEYLERSEISPMSDICLNIALATPTSAPVIKWISALISQDIEKTRRYVIKRQGRDCFKDYCTLEQHEFKRNYINTMFRGNSILTKSLEKFMRIVGHAHLSNIVGSFVHMVVDSRPDLEIDPSRMNLSSLEQDSMCHEDLVLIKSNQVRLLEFTTLLWNLIKNSVEDMPISFKIIFRHLSDELSDKLQQSETGVHNSIAGFLFLRYFCPGLLNPKLFGLINAQQASAVQRPLTLITKMIMAFASRSRFGMKEPWMIPMNVFFYQHEQELMDYFKNVTLGDKSEDELAELVFVNITGVSQKTLSSDDKLVPLCENLDNQFLLDEHLNYARFFDLWKHVLEPKKTTLFEKISEYFSNENVISTEVPLDDSSDTTQDLLPSNPQSLILQDLMPSLSEKNVNKVVLNELHELYGACESCYNAVNSIVFELSEKPETLDAASIPAYTRHISLSWNSDDCTLEYIPEILPHRDWQLFNEVEAQSAKQCKHHKHSAFNISQLSKLDTSSPSPRLTPGVVHNAKISGNALDDRRHSQFPHKRRSSLPNLYNRGDALKINPSRERLVHEGHILACSAPRTTQDSYLMKDNQRFISATMTELTANPVAVPSSASDLSGYQIDADNNNGQTISSQKHVSPIPIKTGASTSTSITSNTGITTPSSSSSSLTNPLSSLSQNHEYPSPSASSSTKRFPKWFRNWP